jgi:dienelactone hydrolase
MTTPVKTDDTRLVRDFGGDRPVIITLCGSTRFKDEINAANARLTLKGYLVISLGLFGHTDMPDADWTTGGSDVKRMLDDLHKRKIDLADRIYVVNPGGYVGESTRGEIRYARQHHKDLEFMEPVDADWLAEVSGISYEGVAEVTTHA